MEELLSKLSSYNIFNNLIPGAVFFLANALVGLYDVEFKSTVLELVSYYFVGMVMSRIGSIVLEPLLKWFGFIRFAAYHDFVEVSRVDDKLDALSESNNLYRTITSALLCFIMLYAVEKAVEALGINAVAYRLVAVIIVSILFLFSYRKQSEYIRKRVAAIMRLRD